VIGRENLHFQDLYQLRITNSFVKNTLVTDETKERIKFNTEILKVLMVVFVASGGGVISLILSDLPNGKDVVITAAGMIMAITSGILVWNLYRETLKLFK
jgi:hypothetical protein